MNKNKIIGIILVTPFIIIGLYTLIVYLLNYGKDGSYMLTLGPILGITVLPLLFGIAFYTRK